jgi:hypothetical protein
VTAEKAGKRERDATKNEKTTEEATEGARMERESASRKTENYKQLNEKSSGDEDNEKRDDRDEGRQEKGETGRKALESTGESGADKIESEGRAKTMTGVWKRKQQGKKEERQNDKSDLKSVNDDATKSTTMIEKDGKRGPTKENSGTNKKAEDIKSN